MNFFRTAFLLFLPIFLLSEPYVSTWLIDPPSGYTVNLSSAPALVSFTKPGHPVNVQVYSFDAGKFSNLEGLSTFIETRLKLKGESASAELPGWGARLTEGQIDYGKGPFYTLLACYFAPAKKSFALVAQTPLSRQAEYEDEIASTLDSFAPETNLAYQPGLVCRLSPAKSGFATPALFGGELFDTGINSGERERYRAVADRETRILFSIGKLTNLAESAMLRFYRMNFRTCYTGLDTFVSGLRGYFDLHHMDDKQKVGFLCASLYLYPSEALNGEKILETPFDMLAEGKGDCDSKTLTLTLLLDKLQLEGEMLVSLADQHAFIGLPEKYFISPQKTFLSGTKGQGLVGIDLLQDPASQVFSPSKWKALPLRYPLK